MSKTKQNSPPVVVAVPNTTELKMRAILNVSDAILEVAKALNGVNVKVNISSCNFTDTKTAIKVEHYKAL